MNALIENTLQIISKISTSKQGYLLQLTDLGYKVLTIWGGDTDDFTYLNEHLFNLYRKEGLDSEKIVKQSSVSKFLKEKTFSSFFINELNYFSERNLHIYILLFSYEADEFTTECKDRIISISKIFE